MDSIFRDKYRCIFIGGYWDYTAFVGTDKPTVMKVELTDKKGIKTINEYPVTLLD